MKKYIGFLAILNYISSRATANNYYSSNETICPYEYIYNPVCGSDQLTYYNRNILECISKENQNKGLGPVFATDGYCKDCKCQNVNLPVCSLDGSTYANECEIDCVNRYRISRGLSIVYLAYRTRCVGPPCDCPTITSPVCGSDGILYRNECVLKCASKNTIALGLPEISLKNVGACSDGCLCPRTYQPVCGSDGKTYINACDIYCENSKVKDKNLKTIEPLYNGRCNACICNTEYEPLCASDGTAFDNQCKFNCENEMRYVAGLPLLTVLGKGECVSCICEAKNDPVCGTNYQTYANECVLKCDSKARAQKGLKGVTVLYKSECQADTPECYCNHCTYNYEPVCGDDYITYWNDCWMTCFSECNERKGLKSVQVLKKAPCF